jgi:hypothetical protein
VELEYTWNELENENVCFTVNGKKLISMGGPDFSGKKDGLYWSPAADENRNLYDVYWKHSGNFGNSEFFTLVSVHPSDIPLSSLLSNF